MKQIAGRLKSRMLSENAKLNMDDRIILLCVTSCFLFFAAAVAFVSLAALYAFFRRGTRKKICAVPYAAWLAVWVALTLGTSLFCKNYNGFLDMLFFALFIVYALYVHSAASPGLAGRVIALSAALSFVCLAVAVIQKLLAHGVRTPSTFLNANYYGYMCEIVLLLCAYMLVRKGLRQPLYLAGIVSGLGGIILSGCRSAWFAVFAGVLILLLCLKQYRKFAVGICLVAAVGAAVLLFPRAMPRSGDFADTKLLREMIWAQAFQGFLKYPLFGQGFMSYIFFSIGRAHRTHAHNIILDILDNYGAVGTATLSLFFVPTFCGWLKKLRSKPVNALIFGLLMATLIHGITDVPIIGYQTGAMFLTLIAL